jgi:LysM repeat protein
MTPSASAATVAAGAAVHPAAQAAATQSRPDTGRLLAAFGQQHQSAAKSSAVRHYTVRNGDSLSAIASRVYHSSAAWPVLYWANRGTIKWANDITTGEVLRIPAKPAKIPAAPAQLQAYTPRHAAPAPQPVTEQDATPVQSQTVEATDVTGGYPGGAFGQCVVERESGGNPDAMNASGHYGLYQFSAATWAAYGGNPADFGNASVAEQNQVFATALAEGGEDNWAPYDGC